MVEDYPNLNPAMLIESWQDLFNCHIDPLALGFELHSLCVHLEERQVLGREVYRIYILKKFLECTHSESYFFQELHVELKGFLVGPSDSLEVKWILLNLRVNCAISKFNRYYPEYIKVLHHITLYYIIIIIIIISQLVEIDFWQLRYTKNEGTPWSLAGQHQERWCWGRWGCSSGPKLLRESETWFGMIGWDLK